MQNTYLFLLMLSILVGCEKSGFLNPPEGANSYQAVSGNQVEGDRNRWERIFSTAQYVYGTKPAQILLDRFELYASQKGTALDIAMGEGRNAVFLAQKGFDVLGVDFSDAAIRKALRLARDRSVRIRTLNADLRKYQIPKNQFDLIVNINFLQRNLIPQMIHGLKKNGIVVFETYTEDQLKNDRGPKVAKEYLLKMGELKREFKNLKILFYQETNDGVHAVASLIAQKA